MGTSEFLILVSVIAIAIVGGLYVLGAGNRSTASIIPSTSGGFSGSGGSCVGNAATTPQSGYEAAYQDQNNHNVNTTAAVVLNLSVYGQQYAYRSVVLSATAFTTDKNVSCLGLVNATFGESKGTAYYSVQYNNASIKGASLQLNNLINNLQFTGLLKEAAIASVVFNNATGSYTSWTGANTIGTSIITPGKAVVGGATYSVQFTVQPGSGAFGGGGVLYYFTANTNFVSATTLSLPGGLVPAAPSAYASTYNTFTGSNTWTFLDSPFTIWGPAGQRQYTVSFTTLSSIGSANTIVNFGYNDCPNFFQNGKLVGTCQNGGKNPNTGADLGTALVMQGGTQESTGPVVAPNGAATVVNVRPQGPIALLSTR